jgi:lipoprotein-releasing system ATP-binding protein
MLLEINGVSKTYETPSGEDRTTVLRDVSLKVEAGDSIAVLGPSGSGKSTLLNIIGALDRPTSGDVMFSGKNLASLGDAELARIRNLEMGFVFQLHYLLPQLTVFENVLVPTVPLGSKSDRIAVKERAFQLLEKVGLQKHLDHFPAQLSGGEMQRVAVVRALINGPKLILADEPTGSLDRDTSDNLGRLLVGLNRDQGTALVVVTHSLALAGLMSRIYKLEDGLLAHHVIQ